MQKHYFRKWSLLTTVLCFITLVSGLGNAAEFTAKLIDHDGDKATTSAITVKDSYYRMDIEEGGQKLFVIVDQKKGITRVMVPSEKQYMELKSQDPQSLMNDPFQAVIYTASHGERRPDGKETVNGYECDKYIISMAGEDIMHEWVSEKYQFPLKIDNLQAPGKYLELSDIVEGPVDLALFEIPEGYTKWIDPSDLPAEIPEWANDLSSAPEITPPFEKEMATGDIVRIPMVEGQSVWVKGAGKDDTEVIAKAIPFKEGRPLKDVNMYNNFAQKGVICERRNETASEVDEVVIYIQKGSVDVTAKLFPMMEKVVAAGDEFRFPVETGDYTDARFANAIDGESECIVSFYKDGLDISEGPLDYRTLSFENPDDNTRRTYDSDAGTEIVVQVTKGKIAIKMGQYDSFEF